MALLESFVGLALLVLIPLAIYLMLSVVLDAFSGADAERVAELEERVNELERERAGEQNPEE
jgi:hypothetical protein